MVKNSPKGRRIAWGVGQAWITEAIGIVEQTAACVNVALKKTNKLQQLEQVTSWGWYEYSDTAGHERLPPGDPLCTLMAFLCRYKVINCKCPLKPDVSTHWAQQLCLTGPGDQRSGTVVTQIFLQGLAGVVKRFFILLEGCCFWRNMTQAWESCPCMV